MKYFAVLALLVVATNGQGMAGMNMNPTNFNLSTRQGIQAFLQMEGINPAQLVTSNCIANGNSCTPGGQPCCLNPVFVCQPAASGQNQCSVTAAHTEHIPQIAQILQTFGVSTQKPIQ